MKQSKKLKIEQKLLHLNNDKNVYAATCCVCCMIAYIPSFDTY